jgi:transcription termination factor NusB
MQTLKQIMDEIAEDVRSSYGSILNEEHIKNAIEYWQLFVHSRMMGLVEEIKKKCGEEDEDVDDNYFRGCAVGVNAHSKKIKNLLNNFLKQ